MNDIIPIGISIVICTYNGEDRLKQTLAHLAQQIDIKDLKIELLIVNNNSTDDTVVVAKKIWSDCGAPFELKILEEPRPGKGHAIETGYDAARYSYIVTVDDDNWLEKNYLNIAFELIHNKPDVALVVGKGIAVFEVEQPEWFGAYAQSSYAVGSPLPKTGYFPREVKQVAGAGMVFKKSIWINLRNTGYGFFTSKGRGKAVGEDSELSLIVNYLGYRNYFDEKLIFYHFMPASRLTWQNHIIMVEGFARTSVLIRLYDYIGSRVTSQKPVSFYKFLLLLIKYSSSGLININNLPYVFNKKELVVGDNNYLNYKYFTVFWQYVYLNKNNLLVIMDQLNNTFKRLEEYKFITKKPGSLSRNTNAGKV